jgi:hypothetical protein
VLPLWQEAFGEIDPEILKPLFRRALKTCKFFPKVAEILAPLESVGETNCEQEWQALLDYVRRWVDPDMPGGRFRGAPELPVEIDHAARAAGGVFWLRECPTSELQWAKKRFTEDLTRSRKTGDLKGLLTGGEFRKLLQKAARSVPQLPAPTPAEREQAVQGSAPLKTAVLCILPSEKRKTLSPEELERQKHYILQKYSKPGNTASSPAGPRHVPETVLVE